MEMEINPEEMRLIMEQIWRNRIHRASMRTVNFVRTDVINRRESHLFRCNTCNSDLKSQHPRRGSCGVIGHCRTYRHQTRFMEIVYNRFRRFGGPALENRWGMMQHPQLLLKALNIPGH